MKALVTGYPGTGKSSVARELQKRGYAAYDTEAMRGYMHAENVSTGKKITIPKPVPRGWFDTTGNYNWDIPRVEALINEHDDIFICALADNQELLYDLFDKIFVLTLDEAELEKRLLLRTSTEYGKDREELADILLLHKHFEDSLFDKGAIRIDVRRPVHDVANEIINLTFNS
jgi:broad-specificity NMP kinase